MNTARPALLVIGGGNMGLAIVRGTIAAGILGPGDLLVVEPDPEKRRAVAAEGAAGEPDARAAAPWLVERPGAQILLAVKPQRLHAVAAEGHDTRGRVVISILAGTPGAKVRSAFGGGCRVVRAMPNLPASVGQGATAVAPSDGALPGDENFALALFRGLGPVVVRIPEDLMDAFTAVGGSGPAYVFYLIQAMIRGAIEVGLDGRTADAVVRQVIIGAASLLAQSTEAPAALRAAVTSKGGTTAAATAVLDDARVPDTIAAAIRAARDRARGLADA